MEQGQLTAAEQATRKALALQLDFPGLYVNLAEIDMLRGELDAAAQAMRKALALHPDTPQQYMYLAQIDILRGNAAAARRDAQTETDPVFGPGVRAMAKQIGSGRKQADAALRDYIAKNGKEQPYLVADLYALRKQPDEMFEWLQRAWTQRDPNLITYLLNDPFLLVYQHDPRFVAFCRKVGLPTPGDNKPASVLTS